ncbi:MAG: metallophosphoesterase family protein [Pikeienuella sp.]
MTNTNKNTLTFAHLTDAHLPLHGAFRARELAGKRAFSALNWKRKRHRAHLRRVVDAVTADIAAYNPDHIAMTGDAVNFGLPREFEGAAEWLSGLGAPKDVSFVPGNHEAIMPGVAEARDKAYHPFITGDDGVAGFPYVRRRGPVAFIGVSTCISTTYFLAQGAVGSVQLQALEQALNDTRGLCRIILIHHPPSGPCKRRKHLRDKAAFAAVLARAGAELVLHGHNHRAQMSWIDGATGRVPVIGSPSASIGPGFHDDLAEWRQMTVQRAAEGFSVDMLRRRLTGDGALEDYGQYRMMVGE